MKAERLFPRKRYTIEPKGAQAMKNAILAIAILIIGIILALEYRYTLVVDSPVVAKIDRLTGDVWIVNAGVWRKVQPQTEIPQQERTAKPQAQAKTK